MTPFSHNLRQELSLATKGVACRDLLGLQLLRMYGLGEALKEHRLRLHLTQSMLAAKAEVSQETISRIEHGRRPRRDTILRIARGLGVPATLLLSAHKAWAASEGPRSLLMDDVLSQQVRRVVAITLVHAGQQILRELEEGTQTSNAGE